MDSTLYRSEGKITAQVDDFPDATDPAGSFVTLSFKQGTGALRMTLPFHMSACAHMIVEAFNAHMTPPPRFDILGAINMVNAAISSTGNDGKYDAEVTNFPTGAATSLGLAVALAANLDADELAAHAVERRDLP